MTIEHWTVSDFYDEKWPITLYQASPAVIFKGSYFTHTMVLCSMEKYIYYLLIIIVCEVQKLFTIFKHICFCCTTGVEIEDIMCNIYE